MGTGGSFSGDKGAGAWCLVKLRDNFTFYLVDYGDKFTFSEITSDGA
jgi:hypothetical protein